MTVRCPSSSKIKLDAIKAALYEVGIDKNYELLSIPVELQDRKDLDIHAEPEGEEQTLAYAYERQKQMRLQHGPTTGIDISIESGIIDGQDVACILLSTTNQKDLVVWSQGVPTPKGTFENARTRGLKTTTVGDIIHENNPAIPANNWQGHFPPYISRQHQIQEAVVSALRKIATF